MALSNGLVCLSMPLKTHDELVNSIPHIVTMQRGYLTFMDAPLVQLDEKHAFTMRNAFEGVQIFGGIGSGKTSGSGRTIAHSFLKAGFGGLVLCAKIDEVDNWWRYAEECGRSNSVIIFNDESPWRFNFLDYAMLTNKTTEGVVDVLMNVLDVANGDAVESAGKEKFWNNTNRQLISHSIDMLYSAYGTISIMDLMEFVSSAAQSVDEGASEAWNATSFHSQTCNKAMNDPFEPLDPRDMRTIMNYFLNWARMDGKLRSNIQTTLITSLRFFEKGPLRDLFSTHSNLVPEMTHEGAIIIVDLPEHTWGEAGITAQHILKYAWQRAAMRRKPDDNNRPIFLWGDESHYFISSYDATFQSTARSYRAATVYMTQSINAYKDAIGGANAHDTTMALLGNLRTHIFHQTNNPDTQKYAAEMVGKGLVWRANEGEGISEGKAQSHGHSSGTSRSTGGSNSLSMTKGRSGDLYLFGAAEGAQMGWSRSETYGSSTSKSHGYNDSRSSSTSQNRGMTKNRGRSQQKDYLLDPSYFRTELRTGGAPNKNTVDGVVVAPNLPNYLHVHFPQN